MGQSKRDKHMDAYERELRSVMARTLWVMAYSSYTENRIADEGNGLGVPGPGESWDEYTPDTPSGAHLAARDLAELFGKTEKIGRRWPMVTLYELAMHADTGEATDLSEMFGTGEKDRRRGPQWALFAHYMTMEALGSGVSWFDDHKEFELEFPSFEINYSGDDLYWSGSVDGGERSPSSDDRPSGSWTEYEFGATMFKTDGFQRVLAGLGIKKLKPVLEPGTPDSAGRRLGLDAWWLWTGKDIEIRTKTNPIDGAATDQRMLNERRDYAGVIAIQGNPRQVKKAAELVNEFASLRPFARRLGLETGADYAPIGGGAAKLRKNAHLIDSKDCSTAYHNSLKADLAKWAKLEHKGYQHIEADEEGPAETIELKDCDRCPSTLAKSMGKGLPPGVPIRNSVPPDLEVGMWVDVNEGNGVPVWQGEVLEVGTRGAGGRNHVNVISAEGVMHVGLSRRLVRQHVGSDRPRRNGEAQRWRVWDSVARDSYVDVTANSYVDAMRRGAFQLKALHHGYTVELNAMPMEGDTATGTRQPYTELVQIDRGGRMSITPAPDQLRQAHRRRH